MSDDKTKTDKSLKDILANSSSPNVGGIVDMLKGKGPSDYNNLFANGLGSFGLGKTVEPRNALSLSPVKLSVGADTALADALGKIKTAQRDALEQLQTQTASTIATMDELAQGVKRLAEGVDAGSRKLKELDRQSDEFHDRTRMYLDEKLKESLNTVQVAQQNLVNTAEKVTSELEALKNGYQSELALAAPATYWDKKREGHETRRKSAAWIVRIAMPLTAAGLAGAIVAGKTFVPAIKDDWHVALAAFVSLTTLTVWWLRLLVRDYLSQQHLENDAAERAVMAQTYVALVSKPNGPPAESILVVMNAMFRPASDGVVKDEMLPPGVAELVSKLNVK